MRANLKVELSTVALDCFFKGNTATDATAFVTVTKILLVGTGSCSDNFKFQLNQNKEHPKVMFPPKNTN